jgi:hypothetical protein
MFELARADKFMKNDEDPTVAALVHARLRVKSNIKGTRVGTLAAMADGGLCQSILITLGRLEQHAGPVEIKLIGKISLEVEHSLECS